MRIGPGSDEHRPARHAGAEGDVRHEETSGAAVIQLKRAALDVEDDLRETDERVGEQAPQEQTLEQLTTRRPDLAPGAPGTHRPDQDQSARLATEHAQQRDHRLPTQAGRQQDPGRQCSRDSSRQVTVRGAASDTDRPHRTYHDDERETWRIGRDEEPGNEGDRERGGEHHHDHDDRIESPSRGALCHRFVADPFTTGGRRDLGHRFITANAERVASTWARSPCDRRLAATIATG